MKLKKLNYMTAFLGDEKVLIPLKDSPNEQDELYDSELIEIHADEYFPRLLDPRMVNRQVLKKICEESKISLQRVWGYRPLQELRTLVAITTNNITLRLALESFFDSLQSTSTEDTYRRAFKSIFQAKFLTEECSVNDFKGYIFPEIFAEIKKFKKSGIRRTATSALLAFINYVNIQLDLNIDKGADVKDPDRDYFEKDSPLSIEEWEAFINSLRQYNSRDALIAEILQLANGPIFAPLPPQILREFDLIRNECIQKAKSFCGPKDIVLMPNKIRKDKPSKGTPLVSLKMVLTMKAHQVFFDKQLIQFERIQRGRLVLQCYPFPSHIFEDLLNLANLENELVFLTSNKVPVRENQLKRSFIKASEKAILSNRVSPARVRIPIPELLYCPFCNKPRWKKICICM